jgi:hypothetical protein
MPIFVIQKKQLKLTIMRKETKDSKKRNYRITIILKDEIIIERFYEERIAKDTIETMKRLFPNLFICGALEKKNKSWNVIWALGND